MCDQYKKTFIPMQLAIWLAACLTVGATRDLTVGLGFLGAMQIGSLAGALLAVRLRGHTQVPAAPEGRRRV